MARDGTYTVAGRFRPSRPFLASRLGILVHGSRVERSECLRGRAGGIPRRRRRIHARHPQHAAGECVGRCGSRAENPGSMSPPHPAAHGPHQRPNSTEERPLHLVPLHFGRPARICECCPWTVRGLRIVPWQVGLEKRTRRRHNSSYERRSESATSMATGKSR